MKKLFIVIFFITLLTFLITINKETTDPTFAEINSDSIVVDYDGNIYHTVTIGSQVWLKENLKSLHYSDGTQINGVFSYNNSDSLANIYGRLYTWSAAMRNSTNQGVQGVCPVGYHVPTDSEWTVLGDYLGGNSIAGGKLKDTGTIHWFPPNTGADNSSGFTALGAGEWENGNFQFMKMSAVLWSSTQTSSSFAKYRYIQYNSASLNPFSYYKTLAYSIRAIKNSSPIGINEGINKLLYSFELKQNYPNPFNSFTKINYYLKYPSNIIFKISDVSGKEVYRETNQDQKEGNYFIIFDASDLSSGIYYYSLQAGDYSKTKKMIFIK